MRTRRRRRRRWRESGTSKIVQSKHTVRKSTKLRLRRRLGLRPRRTASRPRTHRRTAARESAQRYQQQRQRDTHKRERRRLDVGRSCTRTPTPPSRRTPTTRRMRPNSSRRRASARTAAATPPRCTHTARRRRRRPPLGASRRQNGTFGTWRGNGRPARPALACGTPRHPTPAGSSRMRGMAPGRRSDSARRRVRGASGPHRRRQSPCAAMSCS